jgi:hypothetical protein
MYSVFRGFSGSLAQGLVKVGVVKGTLPQQRFWSLESV